MMLRVLATYLMIGALLGQSLAEGIDSETFNVECPNGWLVRSLMPKKDSANGEASTRTTLPSMQSATMSNRTGRIFPPSTNLTTARPEGNACLRCVKFHETFGEYDLPIPIRIFWELENFFFIEICTPALSNKHTKSFSFTSNPVCGLEFSTATDKFREISCQDGDRSTNLYKYSAEMICPSNSKISTIAKGQELSNDRYYDYLNQICIHCKGGSDTFSVCYYSATDISSVQNQTILMEPDRYCGLKIYRYEPLDEQFNSSKLFDHLIRCDVNTELSSDQEKALETNHWFYALIVICSSSFILIIIVVLLLLLFRFSHVRGGNKALGTQRATITVGKQLVNETALNARDPVEEPYDELDQLNDEATRSRGQPKNGPKKKRNELPRESVYWEVLEGDGL